MRQITYDEAYYLYALAYLGLMDEFKFEVMQKVNSSRETDAIYGELSKSFDDTSELLNMLAPKFAGHVNYAGAKAENLFEANKKLIGYLYELYDSDKLSAEEIAEGLSKIAPVSECYVFGMIGKCYSDVKAGRCDRKDSTVVRGTSVSTKTAQLPIQDLNLAAPHTLQWVCSTGS